MNVLSLFDGMSCGQIALTNLGCFPDKYYASEVDKFAIQQTRHVFPDTIHIGDVTRVDVSQLDKIDLIIGGSPCQSFSFAGKQAGMATTENIEVTDLDQYLDLKIMGFEFTGQSYLFWEYMRILTEIRKYNPDVKFLLENVKMSKKWEAVLTNAIGVEPVMINSNLVSAQNRKRLYWTNIAEIAQPEDEGIFIRDILEYDVDAKHRVSTAAIDRFVNHEETKGFGARIVSPDGKANTIVQCCFKNGKDNLIVVSRGTGQVVGLTPDEKYYISDKALDGMINRAKVSAEKRNVFGARIVSPDGKANTLCVSNGSRDANLVAASRGTGQVVGLTPGGKSKRLTSVERDIIVRSGHALRRMTPLECARLQTVPDWYEWVVSGTQIYRMCGNGWTVRVIEHILKNLFV